MGEGVVSCPGCGAKIVSEDKEVDKQLKALAVCRRDYFQLSCYTLALGDADFIHQLVVDAYTAQHYGVKVKPIAITFTLVGLYLVCERGYTGKQVQQVHMWLANKTRGWPKFTPSKKQADMTVQDVLRSPDKKKPEMIKKWSCSVWKIWKHEKKKIESVLNML